MEGPPVAVVVCTLGRPAAASDVLRAVAPQLRPADELLVVDQSSGDLALDPTALPAPARHLARPPGLPAARNAALAATTAPIVLFLDDDVTARAGLVDAHRRAFAAADIGGAVGRILERSVPANATWGTHAVDTLGRVRTNGWGVSAGEVAALKGANMSLRRAAVEAVGGFDEGYTGTALLEEVDVSERLRAAGWRLVFRPDAEVVHWSLPGGGVRQDDPQQWRFRSVGRFVARHRGAGGRLVAGVAFGALAVRDGLREGAGTGLRRWRAFVEGLGSHRAR